MKKCDVEIVELELECSQFTPGAYWVYGSEYYVYKLLVCIPTKIAETDDEDSILEWLENLQSD